MSKPLTKTEMLIQDVENLRSVVTALRCEVSVLRDAVLDSNNDTCYVFDWPKVFAKISVPEIRERVTSDELVRIINNSSQDKPLDLRQARSVRQFFLTNFELDIWDYRKE